MVRNVCSYLGLVIIIYQPPGLTQYNHIWTVTARSTHVGRPDVNYITYSAMNIIQQGSKD
jgi:hypothetical protein